MRTSARRGRHGEHYKTRKEDKEEHRSGRSHNHHAAPHEHKIPVPVWQEFGRVGRDLLLRESKRARQQAKRARRFERKRAFSVSMLGSSGASFA